MRNLLDAPVDKRDKPWTPPAAVLQAQALSDHGRTRRRAIMLLAALGMVATFPAWMQSGSAVAAPAATPGAPAEFLALSQLVTGRAQLDPEIANRIYTSLQARDPAFAGHASTLWQHANAGVDALQHSAMNDPALGQALNAIVTAWYLGEAGGQVVQYKSALANTVVQDVVATPSYCRAAPGYWAAEPPHNAVRAV